MMERNLGSVQFDKYLSLLPLICRDFAGLVVIDINGAVVWHSANMGSSRIGHVRAALAAKGDMFSSKCSLRTETDDGFLYVESAPLADHCNQETFGLIALIRRVRKSTANRVVEFNTREFQPGVIQILADWMVEEFKIYGELESMALELGERYEELNLIYSSDDDVDQFSAAQYELKRLVANCVNFINVDMAMLVLPEKRTNYIECTPGFGEDDSQLIMDELVGELVTLTRTHQRSLVLNTADDYAEYGTLPNLGHKLLSAPIFDGNHEICGCLVVAKSANNRNFTNSDRNLIHVVARKASKIIQASYDKLTGLLTRSSFESIVDEILSNSGPVAVERCLIVLNIDHINITNELYGLKAGDSLIKHFGNLLQKELRSGDHVARLSGDEFGILAVNCSVEHARRISQKLQSVIKQHAFSWNGKEIDFSFRTGIVPAPPSSSGRYLLNAADAVMGVTSKKGSGSLEIFRKDDQEIRIRRENIKWVHRIQEAFRNDLFRLVCQGVYECHDTKSAHHYEVLIRMMDPSGELVSPFKFLTAAERYRLLPDIDRWVVTRTMEMLRPYAQESIDQGITWAINLSGQSISNEEFRRFLVDTLKTSKIPPACLGFEVTESSTIDNIAEARNLMERVKGFGCSVYLDDFGTGLSSFSYMQMLPFDYVKIDGSFIKKVRTDPVSCAMVKAICDVVRSMQARSVAEFVESQEDVDFLRNMGVDLLQGYFLHKPQDMKLVLKDCFSQADQSSLLKRSGR